MKILKYKIVEVVHYDKDGKAVKPEYQIHKQISYFFGLVRVWSTLSYKVMRRSREPYTFESAESAEAFVEVNLCQKLYLDETVYTDIKTIEC